LAIPTCVGMQQSIKRSTIKARFGITHFPCGYRSNIWSILKSRLIPSRVNIWFTWWWTWPHQKAQSQRRNTIFPHLGSRF